MKTNLTPTEMNAFLVGGAVRDGLLGRPVNDRDWVVVGKDVNFMLDNQFRQVGAQFPVFLHPETGEEFALARVERQAGKGHRGFLVVASADVTLEEDLMRRDLTVNAMAMTETGELVDPFNGKSDLKNGVLRHVSKAFSDDPLRVMRVARLAAQLSGFTVADETMALMSQMVQSGQLSELTPERVWKETEKALMSDRPSMFFHVLRECGALAVWFPELDALHAVPQPLLHHPEDCTFVHTMMCVDHAVTLGGNMPVRFAALVHDLGKGVTPKELWPRHFGHEAAGVPLVDALCERLKAPSACQRLGRVVAKEHLRVHRCTEMKGKKVLSLLENLGAFREGDFFDNALLACQLDAQGRLGFLETPYPQRDLLRKARDKALSVTGKSVLEETGEKPGPHVGELMKRRRTSLLNNLQNW